MPNAITAADYCITLEMARRPELHEAMKLAGCDCAEWSWRQGAGGVWMLVRNLTRPARNDDEHEAYHLGELICAAKVLACKRNFVPDAVTRLEMSLDLVAQIAHARALESTDYPQQWKQSAHGPDAAAELVIALAEGRKP